MLEQLEYIQLIWHFTPCLYKPYNNDPQWSQNVGCINVWGLNWWGTSILKRSVCFWKKENYIKGRKKNINCLKKITIISDFCICYYYY